MIKKSTVNNLKNHILVYNDKIITIYKVGLMLPYFTTKQTEILEYKDILDKNNIVIDKTNKMFLDLILDILEYLGTQNPEELDDLCEYNILTMHEQFEEVLEKKSINEKSQAILLTFFLRIAKEISVKKNVIEQKDLNKLYSLMTSKDFKYPSYIGAQKNFALEKMPANIKRMLYLK